MTIKIESIKNLEKIHKMKKIIERILLRKWVYAKLKTLKKK